MSYKAKNDPLFRNDLFCDECTKVYYQFKFGDEWQEELNKDIEKGIFAYTDEQGICLQCLQPTNDSGKF